MQTGKKEPEDIFSGMDGAAPADAGPVITAEPPRTSSMAKRILVIVLGVVVVLAVVGVVVYVFVIRPNAQKAAAPVVSQQPSVTAPTQTTSPTPEQTTPTPAPTPSPSDQNASSTQAPANIPPPTPVAPPAPVAPVVSAPTEGVDTDQDSLTDVEEAILGTNPAVSDTDGDGYSDGSEVQNLFNPLSKTASITQLPAIGIQSWQSMTLLVPRAWTFTIAADGSATMQTGTAASFAFTVTANPSHATLNDWLNATVVDASTYRHFTTKNNLDAAQSPDGLTTYLSAGDTIVSVQYLLNTDPSYEYRTLYAMMIQSLRSAAH